MTYDQRYLTRIICACLGLFFIPLNGLTQAAISARPEELVDAYAKLDRFSGCVLAAKDGKVIFAKGYGMANLELEVPNTTATRFDIGSITKQFTAAAVLQLASAGKLNLNDPVIRYVPDYPKEQAEKVTIHHLLTHTSGIPSLFRAGDGLDDIDATNKPITPAELLGFFKDKKLLFTPGQQFRYSNSGYELLADIIERVSGQSYADYLAEHVFKPARMSDTVVRRSEAILRSRASGYDGYGKEKVNAGCADPSWDYGDGGVYTTVEDLLKWDMALYDNSVLSEDARRELFTPYLQTAGVTADETYYGYGWFIGRQLGRKLIYHTGGTRGFVSVFYRFPDDRVTIIVLSNYFPAPCIEIAKKLSAIIYGEPYELPPMVARRDAIGLSKYVGEYELSPGYVLSVRMSGGELWAKATGQEAWTLFTYDTQASVPKSSELASRARAFLRTVSKGDYVNAAKYFNEQMKKRVPLDAIAKRGWSTTLAKGGAKKISVTDVRRDANRQVDVVTVRVETAKSELVYGLTFDDDKLLAGVYFDTAVPSEVNLLPEGHERFFGDGFAYHTKDARLTFNEDDKGQIRGFTLHQGKDYLARKLR
jgi:CubicO group peptidase (beta-lactamase class C family)